MTDDENIHRRRTAVCPTCGIQTQKVYNVTRRQFMMPISIDGKVENGVCITCSNVSSLKDPPEQSLLLTHNCRGSSQKSPPPPKPRLQPDLEDIKLFQMRQQTTHPPTKDDQMTDPDASASTDTQQQIKMQILSCPFKSDLEALHCFKRQRQTTQSHTRDDQLIDQTAKSDRTDSVPGSLASKQQQIETSTTCAGRNIKHLPTLKIRVVTATNSNEPVLPYITLNLDQCTPPIPAVNSKSPPSSPKFKTLDEAIHFVRQKATRQNDKCEPKPFGQKSTKRPKRQKQQSPARTIERSKQQQSSTRTSKKLKPKQPIEGSQQELNRIMKKDNALSRKIQQSMFVAAVISRKSNKLSGSNETFLAANSKLYPDLRSNFGKYSSMKQCGVCKQRVQGAYYCRLKHCHLEVPDYDGGNSAKCLKELFRKSVEELERIQRSYLGDEHESFSSTDIVAMNHGKSWSLDNLNEDLLLQIASYIPTLKYLIMFCETSKRGHTLLANPTHSEALFRRLHHKKYGGRGTQGKYDTSISWKDRWATIYSFRKSLQHPSKLDIPSNRNLRRTIGVLSEQDEQDAIFYDNPQYGDPERALCNGYFGMHILQLPPPPNSTENWQPPVLLHGDFNGIRIFNSLHDAIRPTNGDREQIAPYVSLGNDEYGGQVLSIIHYDDEKSCINSPCCFLGYASGRVAAVTATLSQNKQQYNFVISAHNQAHECEVTCFTLAKVDKQTTLLFSACCGGVVRSYPNALKSRESFDLISTVAFANFYHCGIFSLTSTVIKSTDESFSVLCTGDREGKIRLWLIGDNISPARSFRHIGQHNSSLHFGTGHLVTKANFINDNVLVTGTNEGSVRIWHLECRSNVGRSIGKSPLPKLNLRYDLISQHSGSVEVCTNIGDILLTSGGDDGKIVGWDINSGMKIDKALSCHSGKHLTRLDNGKEVIVHSAVIDFVLNCADGKLISLCRDGVLTEWTYCSAQIRAD